MNYQEYEPIKERHTTPETALIVGDYPYGFRLRTQIRYWLETTKNGVRFVSQTLNPKTNLWNAPKKSTYSDIGFMVKVKETGYISWLGFGIAYSDENDLNAFLDFIKNIELNDFEQNQIKRFKAILETRKHISYEIKDATNWTDEQRKKNQEEQEQVKGKIGAVYNHYLKKEAN